MTIEMPTYSKVTLNRFATDQWDKTLAYLQKQYSLSEEECKDIFQESFIVLFNKNNSGKLKGLTASLSTYFIGICNKKALESIRAKRNEITTLLDEPLADDEIKEEKINAILELFEEDKERLERTEILVQEIVRNLPNPCNTLLWGFYRDNLTVKALAKMYNYTEGSLKVTKHRCLDKFREKYTQLAKLLFD